MAQSVCYNNNSVGKDEFSGSYSLPLTLVLILVYGMGMVCVSKMEPYVGLADWK